MKTQSPNLTSDEKRIVKAIMEHPDDETIAWHDGYIDAKKHARLARIIRKLSATTPKRKKRKAKEK